MAKNRAIFLDRDGTINVEMKPYTYRLEDFEFMPGAVEGVKILTKAGYTLVIVSSQGGIAKGIQTVEDVERFNRHIIAELKKHSVKIHGVYYCPHHPNGIIKKYSIVCECKKPGTKLFKEAAKEFDIDFKKSWVIGDMERDIEAGIKLGCRTIMVKNPGKGEDYYKNKTAQPDYFVNGLFEAAQIIVEEENIAGDDKGGC